MRVAQIDGCCLTPVVADPSTARGSGRGYRAAATSRDTPIRIVSLNLWNENPPLLERMRRAVAGLGALDADVVALQEVGAVEGRDQATWLGEALGLHVHYAQSWLASSRHEGLAVLTRTRPVSTATHRLPAAEGDPARVLQIVRLDDVAGRVVRVANTHLAYRAEDHAGRAMQAQHVASVLGDTTRTLLCGDLNARPTEPAVRMLTSAAVGLVDSALAGGRGDRDTFALDNEWAAPRLVPGRRIDYVLVGPALHVRSYRLALDTPSTRVSDHYAVVVDVDVDG